MLAVLALIGSWIAFSQWYLARSRLKLDLFDRRSAVIEELRDIIGGTLRDYEVDRQKLLQFNYRLVGTRWLFDENIEKYLKEIIDQLFKVGAQKAVAGEPPHMTLKSVAAYENINEIMVWLAGQPAEIYRRFEPFMRIDEPFETWFLRTSGDQWNRISSWLDDRLRPAKTTRR